MGAIAVIGAGGWGTALAMVLARDGTPVRLWGRDPTAIAALAATRENAARLPGLRLPDGVTPTVDLPTALGDADLVVVAVPTQALQATAATLAGRLSRGASLVLCAKGIERDTGRFPAEVVGDAIPGAPVCILSGPSFAADVGRGLPTAVTLAAPTLALAASLAARLARPGFRLYHTDDGRGVAIGGAAKNVLAIACGIATGRGLGASAAAALTARAFAELAALGQALGGRAETLAGLSGLGDLVLTCGSPHSRNFSYGVALGRGEAPRAAGVIEGVWTAPILVALAARHGVEVPIAAAVAAVLAGSLTIDAAIEHLTNRPLRAERG